MLETIQSCSLAQMGKSAAQSNTVLDGDSALQQFNQIVSEFSSNKLGLDYVRLEQLGIGLAARLPDLKLYSYLVLAVFHNERDDAKRYIKLGALFLALRDLLASPESVEKLSPRSDSRRQGQLQWLSTELALFMEMSPPKPAEAAAFSACKQVAEQLSEQAGAAFGLNHPLLRELRATLNRQAETLPPPFIEQPAPPPPPSVAAIPPPAPAVPPVAAPVIPEPGPMQAASAAAARATVPTPDVALLDMDQVDSQLAELVIRLAANLRSESIDNPAPYWMLRALRWSGHDLLRPAQLAKAQANKGKTELPAPQGHAQLKKQLSQRLAARQSADVVSECEELFAQNPLWLDLQRLIAEGLSALGAERARLVVQSQVGLLIKLCPPLAELRFSDRDGTPLADSETRAWLQKECCGISAAPQDAANTNAPGIADASLPDELLPAVKLLQQRVRQAATGAQRFSLRLQLAELLLERDRSDIAMPVIELLLHDIEAHQLTDWQPELAQKSLRVAVRVARAADQESTKRRALWNRICQVAPADALELGPEIWPG